MPISISSREDTNNTSMLAPAKEALPGVKLRPISLGSLELMRQLGNPLATGEATSDIDTHTLAEFIWVHAAPLEDVVETIYNRSTQTNKAVALFCMAISPADIKRIAANLAGDRESIQAASAAPIPDGEESPNGQTHP